MLRSFGDTLEEPFSCKAGIDLQTSMLLVDGGLVHCMQRIPGQVASGQRQILRQQPKQSEGKCGPSSAVLPWQSILGCTVPKLHCGVGPVCTLYEKQFASHST